LSLVPPRHRQRANSLLRATVDTLWWWTMGRLVAMTIVGLATAVGLFLLGIPLAFTLGALAGIVSFVPTIGAVLAIVPALLVAFQHDAFSPVYVLILYVGIQAIENNLITPIVQQKAVSVPPVVLIISQVLMGLLVGIVGVAIATPLAAVGIELVRELYVEDESPGERQLNAGPTE
jgi:predicted PurR-regulated permease PerM